MNHFETHQTTTQYQTASAGVAEHRVAVDQQSVSQPRITIFAVPKPFQGSAELAQLNAVSSWAHLQPAVDVLLIGSEPGIESAAGKLGVRHASGLKLNEQGTPLLSSAFEIAHRESSAPILIYCNCDLILMNEFLDSIQSIVESGFPSFVAFGRRLDVNVSDRIDFSCPDETRQLRQHAIHVGQQSSLVCKDYFVFNRDCYSSLPDFAVGRGNWDNWMIHNAKQSGIPVIDMGCESRVIHQAHGYGHTNRGRWGCYVAGPEAKQNQQLAGGRHLVTGSTANFRLTSGQLKKIAVSRLNLSFWADLPRFLRLMTDLMITR